LDAEQVRARVSAAFPGGEVVVEGSGANYSVTVVSEVFAGKRAVARQQAVYAALGDAFADGSIHAVNLQTFTPEEWAAASG
jgi:acid stress-induced BolA-like protein IbaG/YrbA